MRLGGPMFLHLILINSSLKALHPSSLSLSLHIAWDRINSFYYDENTPTPRAEYGVLSLPITQKQTLAAISQTTTMCFKFDRKWAKLINSKVQTMEDLVLKLQAVKSSFIHC